MTLKIIIVIVNDDVMRLYICIYLLFCLGCQNKTIKDNENIIALDLKKLSKIQTVSDFVLSEIASNVNIVPLETKDISLISSIDDVVITDTDILITDLPNGVFRFDREGNFVNKIGKIGKGPDEYILLSQIEYDEINKEVYFFTEIGVKLYGLDGDFKRTVSDKRAFELCDHRDGCCYLFDNYFGLMGGYHW